MAFQNPIKWSGTKRVLADEIVSHFPDTIDAFIEPFCGSASVAMALMRSGKKVGRYILIDKNADLIGVHQALQEDPSAVIRRYTAMWSIMQKLEDKEFFYNHIRERYNEDHNPMDFFFLIRTCFNGLIRYNKKGEFNSPYHLNRDGIAPERLKKVVMEWVKFLDANDVTFLMADYMDLDGFKEGDFVYMDPPYANTKGMYFNNFNKEEFYSFMRNLPCPYAFSYNGKSGNEDHTVDVPGDLYTEHIYIKSGVSSFKRLKTDDKKAMVYESLYLKNK